MCLVCFSLFSPVLSLSFWTGLHCSRRKLRKLSSHTHLPVHASLLQFLCGTLVSTFPSRCSLFPRKHSSNLTIALVSTGHSLHAQQESHLNWDSKKQTNKILVISPVSSLCCWLWNSCVNKLYNTMVHSSFIPEFLKFTFPNAQVIIFYINA